jgi:hypothetical protein
MDLNTATGGSGFLSQPLAITKPAASDISTLKMTSSTGRRRRRRRNGKTRVAGGKRKSVKKGRSGRVSKKGRRRHRRSRKLHENL